MKRKAKGSYIFFRVTPEFKSEVKKESQKRGETMTDYILSLIEADLKRENINLATTKQA